MNQVSHQPVPRCAFRKTNGVPCGSPALKNKPYCYFHDRNREQHIDVLDGTPFYQNFEADLPVLEDANAIQVCLTKVFHMLLAGLLDPKFARSLIYCLQIAAQNLKNCNFAPREAELAGNAPARHDQSLEQSTYPTAPRPQSNLSVYDKEDAEFAAAQAQALAGLSETPAETETETDSADEQETADPQAFTIMAFAANGSGDDCRPRRSKRRRGTQLARSSFQEEEVKPTKTRAPINLFDRLAERRERYKKEHDLR